MRKWEKNALNRKISKNHLIQIRKYGMDEHSYLRLIEKAKGICCICKKVKELVLDHCHNSKKVRGLICMQCNSGLGHFADNIQSLLGAIQYLVDFYDPR